MSLPLTHFLVGATIALLIFHNSEHRMVWVYVGGVIAMGPDLSKFIPQLTPIHDSVIASSIFIGHGLLDTVDPHNSIVLAAMMVAVFGLIIGGLLYNECV